MKIGAYVTCIRPTISKSCIGLNPLVKEIEGWGVTSRIATVFLLFITVWNPYMKNPTGATLAPLGNNF